MQLHPIVIVLSCITVTACTIVPPAPLEVEHPLPSEERTEEGIETTTQTEKADALTERLLPTGIIEIGDRNAPLMLLMFTEHHCRYCMEFQKKHFSQLIQDFIDQKKLLLQIAILPLRKYEYSTDAATAFFCAASQGKGLPMHAKLLERRGNNRELLLAYGRELELDEKIFAECLDSDLAKQKIEEQKSLARSLDVTLVPTFFLNGEKMVGLPYYPDLRGWIEEK